MSGITNKNRHFILYGGRGSGKSTSMYNMYKHPLYNTEWSSPITKIEQQVTCYDQETSKDNK